MVLRAAADSLETEVAESQTAAAGGNQKEEVGQNLDRRTAGVEAMMELELATGMIVTAAVARRGQVEDERAADWTVRAALSLGALKQMQYSFVSTLTNVILKS